MTRRSPIITVVAADAGIVEAAPPFPNSAPGQKPHVAAQF